MGVAKERRLIASNPAYSRREKSTGGESAEFSRAARIKEYRLRRGTTMGGGGGRIVPTSEHVNRDERVERSGSWRREYNLFRSPSAVGHRAREFCENAPIIPGRSRRRRRRRRKNRTVIIFRGCY